MTESTAWWHGPAGHFYNCLVDPDTTLPQDQYWEIAVHNVNPSLVGTGKRFSWGIPATNERVESHFVDYDPRVKLALSRVREGLWKEFSSFAGPRLESIIASGKIALIGDASHPLTGALGSGAAFAMQDSWILANALEHTRSRPDAVSAALDIFNEIRSPYYARM
jgi:salicylate hydroxylase